MNRRSFSRHLMAGAATLGWMPFVPKEQLLGAESSPQSTAFKDSDTGRQWLRDWETHILSSEKDRYCDKELGEELGWLVSPFLNGFHYGYLTTGNTQWIDRLFAWSDACIARATPDPDGYRGWPKGNGGGGESDEFNADSLLGEAMLFRPLVSMAGIVLQRTELKPRYESQATKILKLSEELFQKWEARSVWRNVPQGGIWVVPSFGISKTSPGWSPGFKSRATTGFSNPDNKANHIARWHLAMADATGKPIYRERAEQWFRLMKHRIQQRDQGRYVVWNYWEPAGPWDYKPDGSPKHWVGVHPNGGYYQIDVEAMVDALDHGLVFKKDDLNQWIATNRDFMWNQTLKGASFRRIDGGETDPRWKNSPGVLWNALIPHDKTLRQIFVANHRPASWGGIGSTPWFLSLKA
jgi:hypothetical protein